MPGDCRLSQAVHLAHKNTHLEKWLSELQAESHKSDQKLKEMDTLIKMMDLPEIEDLVNKVNEEIEQYEQCLTEKKESEENRKLFTQCDMLTVRCEKEATMEKINELRYAIEKQKKRKQELEEQWQIEDELMKNLLNEKRVLEHSLQEGILQNKSSTRQEENEQKIGEEGHQIQTKTLQELWQAVLQQKPKHYSESFKLALMSILDNLHMNSAYLPEQRDKKHWLDTLSNGKLLALQSQLSSYVVTSANDLQDEQSQINNLYLQYCALEQYKSSHAEHYKQLDEKHDRWRDKLVLLREKLAETAEFIRNGQANLDDIVEREVEGKVQKIVDENMKKILRYQTMVKQIILMSIKNQQNQGERQAIEKERQRLNRFAQQASTGRKLLID